MAYTTINKSGDYFNNKLYSGTGSSNAITGVGFQPDWVWVKNRSTTSNHRMVNAVTGSSELQSSNITNVGADSSYFSSFDSDGFTVGTATDTNNNGSSFVSWNWLANGTGSANTDGSINSTVSANTTSGFSIVKYTGTGANATVGHGLGVAPKMIIVKNTEATENWLVYHQSLENTSALKLNETSAKGSTQYYWNNTSPTSSTFSLGASSEANTNADVNIAYCFADVTGYSKFGSYTGNGNADGTFVYTGFKPAFVLWKRTEDAGYDWDLYDTARDTHNVAFKELIPNGNGVESSSTVLSLDILSNGFKLRTSNGNGNDSGKPYIYMAFAKAPLVGTNNVPCTAR
jgi:hypothetical protein